MIGRMNNIVWIGEPRYDTRLTQTCALRGPQDVDPHGKSTVTKRWNGKGKVNNICANDVWIGEPRYDTRLTQPCALRGPQDVDPHGKSTVGTRWNGNGKVNNTFGSVSHVMTLGSLKPAPYEGLRMLILTWVCVSIQVLV
jgi:hypothetical protein